MKKSKERPLIRTNRGITLIALVITIIVLLILAGVSLNLIAGSDGILEKASNAVGKTEVAGAKEQIELLLADYKSDYFEGKYVEGTETSNPKDYAKAKLELGVVTNNYFAKATGYKVKVYKGNEVTGKAILKGTLQEDGSIKWEDGTVEEDPILEDANANPEKYRHPEQQNSTAIGVGSHGEPVNMDLWVYRYYGDADAADFIWEKSEESYMLYDETTYVGEGTHPTNSYLGTEFDNIIIPQYIKGEEDEEFKPVTGLVGTFYNCKNLINVPEIPNTITNMSYAFLLCNNLITASEIPSSVTDMGSTFSGCTGLTVAPEIPGSVTNMESTFFRCTGLTVAPEIPGTVTNMESTFSGCTGLTVAPEIPGSVTDMGSTFRDCTALTGTVKINAKNCNHMGYDSVGVFGGITNQLTVQVPANSVTYDTIYALYKNSSNITIETF